MAQYKVPQDVEADDKLLGPFTARQFIYLLVVAGSIALAVALFGIFPLLAIIPVPVILFFGALALPLKKDQPMETYFAALVSFYLKPHKRLWEPGQSESTIKITAPKKVEPSRVRDISQDEASHRLSFLAEIVDTEGHAIKGTGLSPIKQEVYAEASKTADMFETSNFATNNIGQVIQSETAARHAAAIQQMKTAIDDVNAWTSTHDTTIQKFSAASTPQPTPSSAIVTPGMPVAPPNAAANQPQIQPQPQPTAPPPPQQPPQPNPTLVDLSRDQDLSIQTIAREANRRQQAHDNEVFIPLH